MEQRKNSDISQRLYETIKTEFEYLQAEFEYDFAFSNFDSKVLQEAVEFKYRNYARKREILILYNKSALTDKSHFDVSVNIVRLPHKDVGDFFSLNIFLEYNGINLDNSFSDVNNEPDLRSMVRKKALALRKYCSDIISGESWNENYYPRKD